MLYSSYIANLAKYLLILVSIIHMHMSDLIVKSAVKESVDGNVAADFYDALDEEVAELLADAERRAGDNGRSTVQPRDL